MYYQNMTYLKAAEIRVLPELSKLIGCIGGNCRQRVYSLLRGLRLRVWAELFKKRLFKILFGQLCSGTFLYL